jgi:hypothetical protein
MFEIPSKFCPSCTVCLRDCPPLVCLDKQADRQKKITASVNILQTRIECLNDVGNLLPFPAYSHNGEPAVVTMPRTETRTESHPLTLFKMYISSDRPKPEYLFLAETAYLAPLPIPNIWFRPNIRRSLPNTTEYQHLTKKITIFWVPSTLSPRISQKSLMFPYT